MLLLWKPAAGAAWSTLLHTSQGGSSTLGTITTPSLNTAAAPTADLLIAIVAPYQAQLGTITDSQTNSWNVAVTDPGQTGSVACRAAYVRSGISTSATHTASNTGTQYCSIAFLAISGSKASGSLGPTNHAMLVGGPTVQPGSITPTVNNSLIITAVGIGGGTGGAATIGAPFTRVESAPYVSGTTFGVAVAYYIQPTAAAINPTWTLPASNSDGSALIVAFPPGP